MMFADTSLLCALYRGEKTTKRVQEFVSSQDISVSISTLVAFEFRQSIRLQTFRFSRDCTQGFSIYQAERMLRDFEDDITTGVVEFLPVDWPDVHSLAERLSAKHTSERGYRTLDVLHVATALHGKAQLFLTVDAAQAVLAQAAGLTVKP